MSDNAAKADHKATLCLPSTGFAMRANLAQREPEMLKGWIAEGLQASIDAKPAGPAGTFVLHDGPPYANGNLHVGHAMNRVLKDIVVRHRTMTGFKAPFVPGNDCHGLPIEQKVRKDLGKAKAAQMSTLQIRKLCDAYARKWVKTQRDEALRMGVSGNWDHPYLTLDPKVEGGILRTLADLVRGGYVYKGLKPVYWCTDCQTALAEAEIEYADHVSPSIYVKFPVLASDGSPALAGLKSPSIVIWTTTPWTLPANVAVSLHPDFEYVALRVTGPLPNGGGEVGEQDYIVAKDLADAFRSAAKLPDAVEVRSGIRGSDLEHLRLRHPVVADRDSVLVLGNHVTLEAGTGAVHTAPGHGMDDFIVGRKYGLPTIVPVDASGRFTSEFQMMEGMTVWDANTPMIAYLDEKDLLVQKSDYNHSYPGCWRCRNPIIYRATDQWFMKIDHDGLRERTLDAIDNHVQWIPAWGRDRIRNMMANRPDWCLSRQRVWGVPIPAIVDTATGEAILDATVVDRVAAIVAEKGSDAWWELPVEDFLPEGFAAGRTFEKETDILDVWFDSGSTHIAVLEARADEGLHSPADLYLEGADQHRGWFHTSLLLGMATRGRAPYKGVLTHGFVLDGKGQAMSKSLGNTIGPDEIIKKHGADVLRLWVASEDYRSDVRVSDVILDHVAETYRRVRNTIRYLIGNLADFDPAANSVPYDELPQIDRWLLHGLRELMAEAKAAYDAYEFHRVVQRVNQFCVVRLSSLYVDVAKDRVYCDGAGSHGRRASQTVQYAAAHALVRLMAPIMAFTADEAFRFLAPGAGSVHMHGFPDAPEYWRDDALEARWDSLLAVRADVMKALEDARQNKKAIGQPLEARIVLHPADAATRVLLETEVDLLPELFITSQAEVAPMGNPPDADDTESPLLTFLDAPAGHVEVRRACGTKCGRCWRVLPTVGEWAADPGLCARCARVVQSFHPE